MKDPRTHDEVGESLYDSEFFEWTQSVAGRLEQGRLSATDLSYVAREIADMGKRDGREVRSCMTVLVMHLMKWASQLNLRNKSTWMSTINEQRDQITALLEDSPSLSIDLTENMASIFSKAARNAAQETGLEFNLFYRPDLFKGRFTHIYGAERERCSMAGLVTC